MNYLRHGQGRAGKSSHNALQINYIIDSRLPRDLLVISGAHGVRLGESIISWTFVVKVMLFRPFVTL